MNEESHGQSKTDAALLFSYSTHGQLWCVFLRSLPSKHLKSVCNPELPNRFKINQPPSTCPFSTQPNPTNTSHHQPRCKNAKQYAAPQTFANFIGLRPAFVEYKLSNHPLRNESCRICFFFNVIKSPFFQNCQICVSSFLKKSGSPLLFVNLLKAKTALKQLNLVNQCGKVLLWSSPKLHPSTLDPILLSSDCFLIPG